MMMAVMSMAVMSMSTLLCLSMCKGRQRGWGYRRGEPATKLGLMIGTFEEQETTRDRMMTAMKKKRTRRRERMAAER